MRRLPPLNALKAFEAAARKESFTGASLELRVSQGAISRHMSKLEDWLGTKLFTRTRRGISLTEAGGEYFRAVRSAFDRLEEETRRIRSDRTTKLLRLKMPPTFAVRWLLPRLVRFHAANRGIEVQITTSHQSVDFEREDIDACILWSARDKPSGKVHYLFGETILPVCSPNFLRKAGKLDDPAELKNHVLLCSLHRLADWPRWLEAAGISDVEGNSGLKFENSTLAYQAAIEDLGVVMAQKGLVEEDLRLGRLVAPFDLEVQTGDGYIFAYPAGRPPHEGLKLFETWILREARMHATQGKDAPESGQTSPPIDLSSVADSFKLDGSTPG